MGMCPVNVHFHLGTEHYSKGQYDETGIGPTENDKDGHHHQDGRRYLSTIGNEDSVRQGYQCKLYDE